MLDGKTIKTFRLLSGLTQSQVAMAVKKSVAHVSNLETSVVIAKPAEEKIIRNLLQIPEDIPQATEREVSRD